MTVREAYEKWSSGMLFNNDYHEQQAAGAFCAGWMAHEAAASNPEGKVASIHSDAIERIWALWPIKKARGAAIPAIKKAVLKCGAKQLADDVTVYANAIKTWPADEKKYVPMCSTWMNQERWLDDRSTWIKGAAAVGSQFSQVN